MIYEKALSDSVIGCAIAVHKEIGEGCLEKVYEKALCVEFDYVLGSIINDKKARYV